MLDFRKQFYSFYDQRRLPAFVLFLDARVGECFGCQILDLVYRESFL
jgi:hypothetical protein